MLVTLAKKRATPLLFCYRVTAGQKRLCGEISLFQAFPRCLLGVATDVFCIKISHKIEPA